MSQTTVVYGLIDMREETRGAVFYVGMGSAKRPLRHLQHGRSKRGHPNFRVHEVMVAHAASGIEPEIVILAECTKYEEAIAIERDYIRRLGRKGIDEGGILLNILPGWSGDETDWRGPIEIRSEASRAHNKRLWADLEHRAKRVLAMRRKHADTQRARDARLANLLAARTPEARAAITAELKERWADPEYRKRMSRVRAEVWRDPEKRAKMMEGRSEGVALSWEDPAVRAARIEGVSAAISEKWSDPAYAEKARAGLRAAWSDPEKKAARVAKMLESRRQTAEQKKAAGQSAPKSPGRSANMKAVNATKSTDSRSAEQASSWTDPDIRKRRLEGIRRAAQNPELTAKRVAAMLKGKRRVAAMKTATGENERAEGQDQNSRSAD